MNHPINEVLSSASSDDKVVRIAYKQIAKRSSMRHSSGDGSCCDPRQLASPSSTLPLKAQGDANESKTQQLLENNEQLSTIRSSKSSMIIASGEYEDTRDPMVKGVPIAPSSTPSTGQMFGLSMFGIAPAVKYPVALKSEEQDTLGISPMNAFRSPGPTCFDNTDDERSTVSDISLEFDNYHRELEDDTMSDISNVSDKTEWCGMKGRDGNEDGSSIVPWDEKDMDIGSAPKLEIYDQEKILLRPPEKWKNMNSPDLSDTFMLKTQV